MLEKIEANGMSFGFILRNDFSCDGIRFFSEPADTLQLGYMNRPKGYLISPHIHKPYLRQVEYTKEILFIKSGKVKANFYGDDESFVMSVILNVGDFIFLSFHGHGFEVLEDCEIIEVKQGPYAAEADKVRFCPELR